MKKILLSRRFTFEEGEVKLALCAGRRWILRQKVWTLPADRSKNGYAHEVPLSKAAMDILQQVPRFLRSDYVFTTNGRSAVSGFQDVPKIATNAPSPEKIGVFTTSGGRLRQAWLGLGFRRTSSRRY